ncbi:hypothetical protein, variant [Spizellomyces punctatus DAOM BR117]|uniref:Origin recognition complex subunit 6 n=1 Tax=Spizellomyces punctatus (strain DAOM BR117) TaxID=645134 RepID=A0A0L0HI01_SPIPD|nr:hypothetical protein, variant [Spizellomyces punctatus DAOM BR117]KND00495.1 hypothetical protein, variant [Spizellomyces punctatus DAOM BR117]|eukprot:XP_016608534.1 hypothetical protein, variant [Spizellomyces punctatus DAOM BR117]
MSEIEDAAEKLGLNLNKRLLGKCSELFRVAHSRNAAACLGKYLSCLPFVCIHLACELEHEMFPYQRVISQLKVPASQYSSALSKVRSILEIASPPTTFHSLGVRIGATQMIPAADLLLEAFKANYGATLSAVQRRRIDWDGPDIIVAIFFVCCKTVMKLGKREASALASNPTQFSNFVQLIEEHCKEEIKELKSDKEKYEASPKTPRKTPTKGRGRRATVHVSGETEDLDESSAETTVETPSGFRTPSKRMKDGDVGIATPTPRKRARMGSSAAAVPLTRTPGRTEQGDVEEAVSGINPMIVHTDIRQTKRYKDFLVWKEQMLVKLPSESVEQAMADIE